jgi:predicted metal-dependent peptidase
MRKPSTSDSKIVSSKKLAELKANASNILAFCRQAMLNQQPFVGGVAMSMDIIPVRDNRIKTACTDGSNIYFDIDFLSRLSEAERIFVIAHEVWHNVLCHFLRTENRDRKIFNIATDIEVNEILMSEGFTVPKSACLASTFGFSKGLSAEQYYDLLLTKNKGQSNKSSNGNSGSSTDDFANDDGQFDRHIYIDDDMKIEDGEQNVDDKYGRVEHDPDFMPEASEKNIEKIRSAAIFTAQQIEKQGGTLSDNAKKLINDMLEPQVPWQELLSQFITKCYGQKNIWSRPNRRFVHSNTYLPSRDGEHINIVVGIDTSASVDEHLPLFLGELNGIVKSFANYQITVVEADYNVQKCTVYNEENLLDLENNKFHTHGGGGTELHSIFDYVTENDIDADAIVMFTDGLNSTPFNEDETPSIPTLWIVTPNGDDSTIHFGEVIKL